MSKLLTLSTRDRVLIAACGLALLTLAAGISLLGIALCCPPAETFRSAAGLLLILSGLVQCRAAWTVAHRSALVSYLGSLAWFKVFACGAVVIYLSALVYGPGPGVEYAFASAMAWWYTVLILPFAASPEMVAQLRNMVGRPTARRIGLVVYVPVIGAACVEIGLRGASYFLGDEEPVAALASVAGMPQVLASAESPRPAIHSRHFVAVVGDEVTLSGNSDTNHLTQVEALLPGVQIVNYGGPELGPKDYLTALGKACQKSPEMVLVFLSVADDITANPKINLFDAKQLQVTRCVASLLPTEQKKSEPAAAPKSADATSEFLQKEAAQLRVCRTPLDDQMQRCWKRTTGHLDRLVDRCRKRGVNMALVVVPSPFQVNPRLCDTLCRRAGCERSDIDIDLPQRRLAAYAQERQVPVVDLLPVLRRCEASPYEHNADAWNELGNSVAAETVSGWLQSRLGGHLAATAELTIRR